jgi:DNA replication protein DnaC
MMINQTINQLLDMRLPSMEAELRRQIELPAMTGLSFEERFGLIVEAEWRGRYNAKIARLIKAARLRFPSASLEDVDFDEVRKLNRALIARMSDMSWLAENRNLFITGPTGTGKTWLASAFGNAACRMGKKVSMHRMSRLLDKLRAARSDGSWAKLVCSLAKPDLLVLDDFGLDRLDTKHCRDLYEIVEDRLGAGSIIITAQLPVSEWHGIFEDKTVADAALDRIVNNSIRIELHGPTRRVFDTYDANSVSGTKRNGNA